MEFDELPALSLCVNIVTILEILFIHTHFHRVVQCVRIVVKASDEFQPTDRDFEQRNRIFALCPSLLNTASRAAMFAL